MIKKRFNWDYFNLWKEFVFMALLKFVKKNNEDIRNGKILIVAPCLIGEFSAAIPSIFDFILRNKDKRVDLLVTSPLKVLAEKISGVGEVFVTKSVYEREHEILTGAVEALGAYQKIIVLRISKKAYEMVKNIKSGRTETVLIPLLQYTFHLMKSLTVGSIPKQWHTFNFEVLGGKERPISFEEIFQLHDNDIPLISNIFSDQGEKIDKKIIIHTGTNWSMEHWSVDKWIELIIKINQSGNFKFIFIGSGEDMDDYEYISTRLTIKTESLIGKTGIFDLACLMKKADYFIGIDSGPVNIAHLVDLRSITILGAGPHMYMPTNPLDIVIDKTNGRGAYQKFFSVKDGFIDKISAEEVFSAFQYMVKSV